MEMWNISIDRGGTFTDIVAKTNTGKIVSLKLLSENKKHYGDAALEGIRQILNLDKRSKIPVEKIETVKMGTTVATNALLERKGDRTLLLTSSGMQDALKIGYQNRPDIFALHVKLPEVLYEKVVEVEERISTTGKVLKPLNHKEVRQKLQAAYHDGIRSLAVAFLHSYRYRQHEEIVGEIAKEVGFTQVSLSCEVSPLIKYVMRGDTAVVDAYLSPLLSRYVNRVNAGLGLFPNPVLEIKKPQKQKLKNKVFFMLSNGGLTLASFFRGKDAVLSGPAGGVVGMVKTAGMAGFTKIIGFDMGGTSTDVTHYNGEYERSFENTVAGVRMRVPMMNIHTVAAGGGSVLGYASGRFTVGPESAGAYPGPACYGNGGASYGYGLQFAVGKTPTKILSSSFWQKR